MFTYTIENFQEFMRPYHKDSDFLRYAKNSGNSRYITDIKEYYELNFTFNSHGASYSLFFETEEDYIKFVVAHG